MSALAVGARHDGLRGSAAAVLTSVAVVALVSSSSAVRSVVLLSWVVPVVWAAVVDARESRLPDRIVVVGAVVFGALLVVVSLLWGDWSAPIGAVAGALVLGVAFALVHVAFPAGFGFGDVKYGVLLGLGLGVLRPGLGVVVFATAVLVQVLVVWWRPWRAQRAPDADRRSAPFGPALAIAAVGWMAVSLVSGGGL